MRATMTTPDTTAAATDALEATDAPEATAASSSADALLSLDGVSKIYGDLHALDNVSLEIPRGQWVSIVGPSGSGKTTLMNIVGAMDTATEGTVMLDGHDISDLTADELTEVRCRTIGLVFQQFHLIGHLTALENVMVAQYYHSMPDEKEALEALDRVGLADRASHLPRQLSGGEQQRVCVARSTRTARPSWSSPTTRSLPNRASVRSDSTTVRSSKKPGTTTTSRREPPASSSPAATAKAAAERTKCDDHHPTHPRQPIPMGSPGLVRGPRRARRNHPGRVYA